MNILFVSVFVLCHLWTILFVDARPMKGSHTSMVVPALALAPTAMFGEVKKYSDTKQIIF